MIKNKMLTFTTFALFPGTWIAEIRTEAEQEMVEACLSNQNCYLELHH